MGTLHVIPKRYPRPGTIEYQIHTIRECFSQLAPHERRMICRIVLAIWLANSFEQRGGK